MTTTDTRSGRGVSLGQPLPSPLDSLPPRIVCDSPTLQRHAERPWFRAFVAQHLGLALTPPVLPSREDAWVPDRALARHALITGSSGSGKTRLTEYILGQALSLGQSLVGIEPKLMTILRLAAQAQRAGLAPEQIIVLSPRLPRLPGWNPFLTSVPPAQAVADFVAVLERSTSGWGPRLGDLLTNAAELIAGHRLSLLEMVEALRREDYLRGLLRTPPRRDSLGYREAHRFFTHEFLMWSQSARNEALGPLLNKVRELLRNECLSAVLCATNNTLDLSSLWQRQGVVLVHLDEATLGETGTRLLAGLMATSLLQTARRALGPVPVTLMLDEAATAERFVGETLAQIVTTSRERNLRLLACCQNVSQLSDGLRHDLLTSTAVQVAFRMSAEDARLVGRNMAVGVPPRLMRVRAEAGPAHLQTGQPERALWRHPVLNAHKRQLQVSPTLWDRLRWRGFFDGGMHEDSDPLETLMRQAGRLYVRAADTGESVELRHYVQGLRADEWWLDGPAPLSLVVAFPRPRLTGAEQLGEREAAGLWARTLQELPVQHAVLQVEGGSPVLLRVQDMPDAPPPQELKAYLSASLHISGMTSVQSQEMREARIREMDQIAESSQSVQISSASRGAAAGTGATVRAASGKRALEAEGGCRVRASDSGKRLRADGPSLPLTYLEEEVGTDGSLA